MRTKGKKPKTIIDWDGVERDYCHGDMSIRQLAKWYKLSESMIRKKATEKGWVRSAGTAPKAPVKRKDLTVTVSIPDTVATVENTAPEAIIDRGRNLALRMMDELEATTSKLDALKVFIEEATEDDESQRRLEALMKAVSLPTRANTLRNIVLAVETMAKTTSAVPPGGKKAAKQQAANKVGGKFAVPSGPKLAIDNTR
jgi:hypothetical protein